MREILIQLPSATLARCYGGFPMSENESNRRAFLTNAGLLALGAGAAGSVSAATESGGHEQHTSGKYADLIREAHHCMETGDACAAHCVNDMRTGNTELLECLIQVQELVIACQALSRLAAFDSEHVNTYAAATIEVCDTCEAECRKFEDQHVQCKDCAEACVECANECRKILGRA